MGKLVVSEFVTLDGVMEDPGGAEGLDGGGWAFRFERGDEGDRFKLDELLAADALLLGRTTYEGFAKAWPSITDEAGFADKMNGMPKFVVSSTLDEAGATWNNTTIVCGEIATEVAKLREQHHLLVAGSAQLVGALAAADLVDELRLMVYPVLLGNGKRLFSDDAAGTRAFAFREVGTAGDVVTMTLTRSRA